MKYSLNLIKKFVDINKPDSEVLDLVSRKIAEIEEVKDYSQAYQNISIAKIVEAKDHPNADKLGVYQVDTGDSTVQVVAGDKTLKSGDFVVYIPPGEAVPSTYFGEKFVISKTKLRDEESNGMLASLKELGISQEHEKVFRLEDGEVGKSVGEYFELNDKVFEIENKSITHRPDLFGHLGMAREVAGVLGIKFNSPESFLKSELSETKGELELKLNVESKMVSRFTLLALKDIEVTSSEIEQQAFLQKLGIKPINNIVDLTNWTWLVYAQPMHAFDYDKVKSIDANVEINVYDAKGGEEIELIDERKLKLKGGEIVISAGNTPISLAGAMGGSSTQVDQDTKNVIFEAASFDMYRIRKTSMEHGVFTDAVTLFSRGQDNHKPAHIQNIVINELNKSDAFSYLDYGTRSEKPSIEVASGQVSKLLGKDISKDEIVQTLNHVEIVAGLEGSKIVVKVPFWRKDLNIAEDIIEEIGRLYGFDELGFSLPTRSVDAVKQNSLIQLKNQLRTRLSALGANEVLTYNFVSGKLLKKAGYSQEKLYTIKNALSPKLEYMRKSIVPNLLEKAQVNYKQKFNDFVLFEIGKGHDQTNLDENKLPNEIENLTLVAVQDQDPYYLAKRYLDQIFADLSLSVDYVKFDQDSTDYSLHPGRSAWVKVQDKVIGYIGEPKIAVKQNFKLKNVAVVEVDLKKTDQLKSRTTYTPLSSYPSSQKDITVNLKDDYSYAELLKSVNSYLVKQGIANEITFKSIFRNKDMSDSRNITLSLELYSYQRTLTNSEVGDLFDGLAKLLNEKYIAQIV